MAAEPIATAEGFAARYPDTTEVDSASLAPVLAAADITLTALARGQQLSRSSLDLRPFRDESVPWPDRSGLFAPAVGSITKIPMPMAVTAVVAVSVGGSALTEDADFRVAADGVVLNLLRLSSTWPTAEPTGGDDDFVVTVTTGFTPDQLVRNAALEIAKDIVDAGLAQKCGDDPHVVSRTAQGITLQYDPEQGPAERMPSVARLMERIERRPVTPEVYTPGIEGWQFWESPSNATPWAD